MTDEAQEGSGERLTLRLIVRELFERFFSLERGWLCTFKELFTEPGPMIRRYIDGERLVYANPFAYLLVGIAINALVQKTVGFQTSTIEQVLSNPELTPGQVLVIQDLQRLLFKNLLYLSLVILIPFAILLRLFFRRSEFNLAEMVMFALYTVGHTAMFAVVVLPLGMLLSLHPAIIGMPLTLAYFSFAALGFFGGRVLTVLKTCAAYLLGLGSSGVAILLATFLYIILFQLSYFKGGDGWNLITAADQGATTVAQSLIEKGSDVNMTLRRTPLHVAVDRGHLEFVDLLLSKGADVDARDHRGQVPMLFAIRRQHTAIIQRLMEAGADVFRLNFSHGDQAGKAVLIQRLRDLSRRRQQAVRTKPIQPRQAPHPTPQPGTSQHRRSSRTRSRQTRVDHQRTPV